VVFIWSWPPRRRRPRYGAPPGWGPGYGPGYGPPPGYYGYRRPGGSCLRDLLFLNAGCCLAESLGCGMDLLYVAPSAARSLRLDGRGSVADRMIAAVRFYQREISPKRPPVCHFTPSCSAYAVGALEQHGARRGSWLTLKRLVRCRPGAVGGHDPAPAAARTGSILGVSAADGVTHPAQSP
jgi:putative membrane protein insertion efficiency factor